MIRNCDICHGKEYDILYRVKDFDIMRCSTCNLVYAGVTEEDIENAYEADYYKSVYPDYESDKNIHDINNNDLLRKVEKHFSPGTLIEIGSAFGFFLEAASKRSWKASGYETSKYASEIACKKFQQDVKNIDFLKADIQEKVDIVCMFDTIEHLLQPSLFIKKISNQLKDGGGLVVTTGDISSWIARFSGAKWRMIVPPLHVYYYSRVTITRLLEQYGFKILSIRNESKYQNLNSIFKVQFGIDKKYVPQIPVKVNLGDIMQVIAQKK